MNRRQRARIACLASIACSSVFLVIEIAVGAYGEAVAQGSLLILAVALWRQHRDRDAGRSSTLPPPSPETQRLPRIG